MNEQLSTPSDWKPPAAGQHGEFRARVPLPENSQPPFEVFVNGIPQLEGRDFERHGDDLYFYA
ncbi:MAG: hypothetical protein HZB14_05510, partial [Actinobacteria bacterium]|nr:hypothetical protein [Actinomycetota bacterium]